MERSSKEIEEWVLVDPKYQYPCRRCKSLNLGYRVKESYCGGHEDCQYLCFDCNYDWWVDGIDS